MTGKQRLKEVQFLDGSSGFCTCEDDAHHIVKSGRQKTREILERIVAPNHPWFDSEKAVDQALDSIEEVMKSDEKYLHQYFHYYLSHMYPDDFIKNMLNDGFEEPLDPDYLCDAIYELAERLGYKLEDNMWVASAQDQPNRGRWESK